MTINDIVLEMKKHPDYKNAGMILYHNGTVRNTSRSGEKVSALEIYVDHPGLDKLIEEQKKRPGIIEILVHIEENKKLYPGDDVMYLAVAGDIREHVIAVLTDTLEAIKTEFTRKKEFFPE